MFICTYELQSKRLSSPFISPIMENQMENEMHMESVCCAAGTTMKVLTAMDTGYSRGHGDVVSISTPRKSHIMVPTILVKQATCYVWLTVHAKVTCTSSSLYKRDKRLDRFCHNLHLGGS